MEFYFFSGFALYACAGISALILTTAFVISQIARPVSSTGVLILALVFGAMALTVTSLMHGAIYNDANICLFVIFVIYAGILCVVEQQMEFTRINASGETTSTAIDVIFGLYVIILVAIYTLYQDEHEIPFGPEDLLDAYAGDEERWQSLALGNAFKRQVCSVW